jgi:AraC family transcriptional regulator
LSSLYNVITQEGNIMDYKIIEKEAFDIIEKEEAHTIENSENAK